MRRNGSSRLRRDPVGQALGRQRLPDAQRQLAGVAQRGEQLGRAAPAVLVVDAGDAGRGGRRQRLAHRVERLGAARLGVGVVELPGRLLAQDAGRLAGGVALDDAARHVQRVRHRERRRAHPQRMAVVRAQCDLRPRRDRVERVARRLLAPQLVAPAAPAQPAARLHLGRGHALERLGERGAAEQPQLPPAERPAREVHVRVDQARHDARAADVDPPRARRRVGDVVEHGGDPVALDHDRGGERALRIQRAHAAPEQDASFSRRARLHRVPDVRLRRAVGVVRL